MVNRILANTLAGLMAASVIVCITGCGQRSARFVSEPPESTPGWKDYTATITEYGTPTELDEDSEQAADDVRAQGAANPAYTEYDAADFPDAAPGWYEREDGWYYFDDELRMLTGWIEVKGDYYCMDEHGLMYADTVIDGWYLDKDGRCLDDIPADYTEPSGEDVTGAESESSEDGDGTDSEANASASSSSTSRTAASQQQITAAQRQTTADSRTAAQPTTTDPTEAQNVETKETEDSLESTEQESESIEETDKQSEVIIATRAEEDTEEESETEKASYAVSDGHEAGRRPH